MRRRPRGRSERAQDAGTPVSQAYARHGFSLKRVIGRFMRGFSGIEDIAREAFLRAYAALSQPSRKSRQIADNIEDFDESAVIGAQSSAKDEISTHQSLGLQCEAVVELPPQCRRVYLLRKVHSLSNFRRQANVLAELPVPLKLQQRAPAGTNGQKFWALLAVVCTALASLLPCSMTH